MIKEFDLKIYLGSNLEWEPQYMASGSGDEWQQALMIRLPDSDGVISINLEDCWQEAITHKLEQLQQEVIGLQTVVKFGDTVQSKSRYTAVIKLQYT